ncbi:MAG: hypothetical protein HQ495_14875 [Alphaproteobacteria bacterium]|nr:hypothetical protein [Alphaproteobacteria bacterium]
MRRGLHIWLAMLLAVDLVRPVIAHADDGGSKNLIMKHFEESALGTGRVQKLPNQITLKVWRRPRYFDKAPPIQNFSTDDIAQRLQELLPSFSEVSGVSIRLIDGGEPNLLVILDGNKGKGCSAELPNPDREGVSRLFIQQDDWRFVADACLVHELGHAFGLIHACAVKVSIMCPKHLTGRLARGEIAEIEAIDVLTLQILYDKRLLNGMSAAQALPIANAILDEMWPKIMNESVGTIIVDAPSLIVGDGGTGEVREDQSEFSGNHDQK